MGRGGVYTAGPQAGCDKIPSSGLDYTSGFNITSRATEGKAKELWSSFRHLRHQFDQNTFKKAST